MHLQICTNNLLSALLLRMTAIIVFLICWKSTVCGKRTDSNMVLMKKKPSSSSCTSLLKLPICSMFCCCCCHFTFDRCSINIWDEMGGGYRQNKWLWKSILTCLKVHYTQFKGCNSSSNVRRQLKKNCAPQIKKIPPRYRSNLIVKLIPIYSMGPSFVYVCMVGWLTKSAFKHPN